MGEAPRQIGPYTVEAEIGRGGMGVVYRARDPKLDRGVAIKVLPDEVARDPARVERFRREATTLAALNHPYILTVHDVDTEGDTVYVVTELLEGATLRERLRSSRPDWRRAAEIGAAVAEGLAAAHDRGIVHRDLKPDNIFVTNDGIVKILDFGLARARGEDRAAADDATRTHATAPGTVMGTVGYMAPEQVRGEAADARSDIFSFGCVLYEMLTGKLAFARDTSAESMTAILRESPSPPREAVADLPPELERVLLRCLEKEPGDRFQSARDLAFALKGSKSESGVRPPVSGAHVVPAAAAAARGMPRWLPALAAVLVLAAAAGWWLTRDAGDAATPAGDRAITAMAVLPFANESGGAEMDFLGDGIAENVINSLTRLPDLRVIPRSTAFRHRGRDAELEAVARELGVQGIVTGRVSRRGDRLVIGVELTDARSVSQLWGERYDTSVDEILTVEADMARRITDALEITLSGEQAERLKKRYTDVPSAHLAYMEARHAWGKRTAGGFRRSLELYDQAIAADPTFALAHASKAETYVLQMLYIGPPSQYVAPLRESVASALRVDPNLAEAYPAHGFLKWLELDWAGAESAFLRAIELNPDYATAEHWYAVYLYAIGDPDGRLRHLEQARRIDPGSLIIASDLAVSYAVKGQTEKAEQILLEVIETAPTFWRALDGLGYTYYREQRYGDAARSIERAAEIAGEIPWLDGSLGMMYGLAGNAERAREQLARLEERAATRHVPPTGFARAYVGVGDMDRCFEWLERASAEKDPLLMVGIPRSYAEIANDPRWQAIEESMDLPER